MVSCRFVAVLVVLAAGASSAKAKIIDFKSLPQTIPGLVKFLGTSRDQNIRTVGALSLDHRLRDTGTELKTPEEVDPMLDLVLGQIFKNMVSESDIYTWDRDNYGPRGDVVCKDKVLVYPGRITAGFERKYTVKVAGKRVDRGSVGRECTVTVTAAKTEDEWHQWTGSKGWGINPHAVFVAENAARVGVTFYSPGSSTVPSPRLERPHYIGFVSRAKEGEEYKLLSVEPPTSTDYRKQDCNVYPVDSKPAEYEKTLRVANWLEAVRVLNPGRENFLGNESTIFQLAWSGNDVLPVADKGILEASRRSESPLVRAAVALKLSKMGYPPEASELADAITALKHPAARNELIRELVKILGPRFDANAKPSDAELAELAKLVSPDPKNPIQVKDLKIVDDLARMRVFNQKFDGWLFRKLPDGWQIIGQLR